MDFLADDIITGERLQALSEITVTTKPMVRFHRSMRAAGVRNIALFQGDQEQLEPTPDALARLRGKRRIFVYTHLLPSFFEHVFPRLDHSFVLITHNSDSPVDARYLPQLGDDRIRAWFGQNAAIRHPKLAPLPIGLANAQWRHGKLMRFIEQVRRPPAERQPLIYVNFLVRTNPAVRAPILDSMSELKNAWIAPKRRFRRYLSDMASCRWCVSPPGNGIDCHRTWEALYLGVVPVVEQGVCGEDLYRGLPVVECEDLTRLDPAQVAANTLAVTQNPREWHRMTMSYWRLRISAEAEAIASS
ncbi:MAG: hypothetical protein JWQ89_2368 [Devosia sp.]|uniref:hypothetical protein n=1 Tax=Devosia sp. TaxID=1871048 RepID=UPI002620A2F4|nr:hypothetical protein [Devosia sp.]MDB5540641.1 hypothetical protein [Devosia sp.]